MDAVVMQADAPSEENEHADQQQGNPCPVAELERVKGCQHADRVQGTQRVAC